MWKNTSASGWVYRQTSDIGNVHHKFLRDVAELKTKQNKIPCRLNSEINYAEPKKKFCAAANVFKVQQIPNLDLFRQMRYL